MILFPIGLQDSAVNRIPVVSIGIAVTCLLVLIVTWVIPGDPEERSDLQGVVEYWAEHPYLELPDDLEERHLDEEAIEALRESAAEAGLARPPDEVVAREQEELDARCAKAVGALEDSPMRTWSLVPARGVAQPGWFTHMWLHFGWLHLIGNLFFLYLVGPFLEDVWGRVVYLGFYVAGGLFAAASHAVLDLGSEAMMAGASGAIAACVGAFVFRFATRRIRMVYFIWILRPIFGTFLMPAWLWGIFWFGGEVLDLLLYGSSAGVAFMAHIGGFGFGVLAAFGAKALRIEERWISPDLDAKTGWQQHPGIEKARVALAAGNAALARAAYAEVLRSQPDHVEALLGLTRLELSGGDAAAGIARLDRLLARLADRGEGGAIRAVLDELGPDAPLERLRAAVAFRAAQALEKDAAAAPETIERLYEIAAASPGAIAAKALIRAAELRLARNEGVEQVLEHARRLRELPGVAPELLSRGRELEQRARAALDAAAAPAPDRSPVAIELPPEEAGAGSRGLELIPQHAAAARPPAPPAPSEARRAKPTGGATSPREARSGNPAPARGGPIAGHALSAGAAARFPALELAAPAPKPRIVLCRLVSLGATELEIESSEHRRAQFPLGRVQAISAGVVERVVTSRGEQRDVLLVDLIVDWGSGGQGPHVLRLPAGLMGLAQTHPGVAEAEACARVVGALLEASGATPLFDRNALGGGFPRHPDLASLDAVLGGG